MGLTSHHHADALPVVTNSQSFDPRSGNRLERVIFNFRGWVVLLCAVTTVLLGWSATKLTLNASFEQILPVTHPYIRNYLEHRQDLRALGNVLRVSVENVRGDIFDSAYLETLKQVNDELFLTPGVDRAWLKSLWTPFVRWNEVTEEGFTGGPVMPDNYDGSPAAIGQLRSNIARAGILGSLVARDFKSSVIVVPLLDKLPDGRKLDYGALSRLIEERVRQRFAGAPDAAVRIHVIGFAKLVGDLIAGVAQMAMYFGAAFVIAALLIYGHTRCLRSTALLLVCSLIAVVWQLGAIAALGFELDPYSVLVPFLVFAIGVSHGAQKMNGIMQDVARGTHRYVAARYTFRRLFVAGLTALLADAVAFALLMSIEIPVIRELALIASLGVAVLVFTNLILLPVLLSYVGVSATAAADVARHAPKEGDRVVNLLVRFTERRWATGVLVVTALLTGAGYMVSRGLQIGDVDPGAPELRADSRYNRDVAFFNANYGLSTDQFAVIVKTPAGMCDRYQTLVDADRLAWTLQQVEGVQSVVSLADPIQFYTAGSNEGNPKWLTISRNQDVINFGSRSASVSNPDLMTLNCEVTPVIAFLRDHKAGTLARVLQASEAFAVENDRDEVRFLPVAGSAGIEAVTNIVVEKANARMLWYVYASVVLLCLITFRSWRAVVVAVIPLAVTSVLCEALMVMLGIGVKVATLPVVALGVGIGVDYALYLLSVQLSRQRAGADVTEAYRYALGFTGKVVALVGITLAAGVATWALSPIKFQADMGVLLSFMFIWNMVGALVLIPALSHFLLADVGRRSAIPAAAAKVA